MTTYILVDAANLFHRVKHTTTGDAAMKAGMALHICFNALRSMWRRFKADHIVICCEGKSWRRKVYPEYKAHRRVQEALKTKSEREEDDLYFGAMDYFISFLENKTNVTVLKGDGLEGDDLIASWIDYHPDDHHVILSSDSDFYQLLSDKVTIYDGIKGWTITIKEVLDENGKPAVKKKTVNESVVTKTGKKKTVKKTVETEILPPDPEYELFKKIIRGDASDNIMSANPGIRENGSSKKPGIREAFEDREGRGFVWNLFMQDTWKDHEGNEIRVLDAYNQNKQLIDLRAQPQEIKDLAQHVIQEATKKPRKQGVGIWFLRFCEEMALYNIAKSPTDYSGMLSSGYPGNEN